MTCTRFNCLFSAVWVLSSSSCIPRAYNTPELATPLDQHSNRFALDVQPEAVGKFDEPPLRRTISVAIEKFENHFGSTAMPIRVAVGGQGCLRTGYQFESKKLVFCKNTNTRAFGTESVDVVNHEVFHALLCRAKPTLCTSEFLKTEEHRAIHEALADVFAHTLNPDETFGENFYISLPVIRNYHTRSCYSLLEGEHAKGNALVSAMLDAKVSLSTVAEWLNKEIFSTEKIADAIASSDVCLRANGPQAEIVPLNVPISKLNRYRLGKNSPLQIAVKTNTVLAEKFPRFEVRWPKTMQLFRVESKSLDRMNPVFEITAQADKGWEKVTFEFWSETLLATRSLYLAVDSEAPSPLP